MKGSEEMARLREGVSSASLAPDVTTRRGDPLLPTSRPNDSPYSRHEETLGWNRSKGSCLLPSHMKCRTRACGDARSRAGQSSGDDAELTVGFGRRFASLVRWQDISLDRIMLVRSRRRWDAAFCAAAVNLTAASGFLSRASRPSLAFPSPCRSHLLPLAGTITMAVGLT